MVIYKSIPNGESPYDSIYYWWWIPWFDNSESLFMTPWRKVPGEKKHHEHHFSWAGQLKTIETVLPPSISRKWKMGFSKMGHFNISFILWVTFKIEPCFRRNGNHRFFFTYRVPFSRAVFITFFSSGCGLWDGRTWRTWTQITWRCLGFMPTLAFRQTFNVPWETHDLPSFFRGYGAPY